MDEKIVVNFHDEETNQNIAVTFTINENELDYNVVLDPMPKDPANQDLGISGLMAEIFLKAIHENFSGSIEDQDNENESVDEEEYDDSTPFSLLDN